jgi:hypothetical protein
VLAGGTNVDGSIMRKLQAHPAQSFAYVSLVDAPASQAMLRLNGLL